MAFHTFPLRSFKAKGTAASLSFIFLVVATLLLAACGNPPANNSGPKVLKAIANTNGSYTESFTPFGANPNDGTFMIYEPMVFVDAINGQETPMLATAHTFNSDNTQLSFTIRQGVKWSDGQAFTADDVVFTFNLLKQYPAADGNALWSYLSSVEKSDPNTVVFTFKTANVPLLPYIEGVNIVPQHTWQTAGDPTKFVNSTPIGTGPMKLKSFTAQLITLVKNSDYWQADKVKVDELQYQAVGNAQAAILALQSHTVDWSGVFSPAVNTFVKADSAHNHQYMVPVAPVSLILNQTIYPLNQLPVRQAISVALDRQQMSSAGEAGLEPVISPTGLTAGQKDFMDPQYASLTFGAPDPNKAAQILTSAGYTKGSDGIFVDPHGGKLSFTAEVPSDFNDYVQNLQIAAQNLKAAGIDLKVNQVSDDSYFNDRGSGNYQIMMVGALYGPTPFYYFNDILNSANIGQGGLNWPRWKDTATDQFLNQYATSTDPNVQKQALYGIQKIMVEQLPVIPLLGAIEFFEYTTVKWTGWPTPDNPYAIGSPYTRPPGDNTQVILHLTPA
ncbi:MAG TPA: ABC transporter substrate-binding protein [Ktedonobacterales bacterium]